MSTAGLVSSAKMTMCPAILPRGILDGKVDVYDGNKASLRASLVLFERLLG